MKMQIADTAYGCRVCCRLRCRNAPFFRKICHSKRQIQQSAKATASGRPTARDWDDDGIPLVKSTSCGRDEQAPTIIKLPSLRDPDGNKLCALFRPKA